MATKPIAKKTRGNRDSLPATILSSIRKAMVKDYLKLTEDDTPPYYFNSEESDVIIRKLALRGLNELEIRDYFCLNEVQWEQTKKDRPKIMPYIRHAEVRLKTFAFECLMLKMMAGDINAIKFYLKAQCGWTEDAPEVVPPSALNVPHVNFNLSDPIEAARIYKNIMTDG